VKIDIGEDNTIIFSFPGSNDVTTLGFPGSNDVTTAQFGDCPPYSQLGEAFNEVRKEMMHSYDVVTILHHGD